MPNLNVRVVHDRQVVDKLPGRDRSQVVDWFLEIERD